jgi:hypothetical protein
VRGLPSVHQRLRITRDRWQAVRRADITISGLAACRPLFGLGEAAGLHHPPADATAAIAAPGE